MIKSKDSVINLGSHIREIDKKVIDNKNIKNGKLLDAKGKKFTGIVDYAYRDSEYSYTIFVYKGKIVSSGKAK